MVREMYMILRQQAALGYEDGTPHRTHKTRHRRTFSCVSAHVTVAHHLPTSHRWLKNELSIQFCVSLKSSGRHMFRRNLLGVPDPIPSFPSTPPLTQPSLQTGWKNPARCLAEWLNKASSQVPRRLLQVTCRSTTWVVALWALPFR